MIELNLLFLVPRNKRAIELDLAFFFWWESMGD